VLKKYYSGDSIKENKTGGEYETYEGEERSVRGFGGDR
jgi:hypothetical protein